MTTRPRSMLRPYQERLAKMISERDGLLFNIPMGLGKTATVLTAIADLVEKKPEARILIVAPLRVANYVWSEEILQWDHTSKLKFSIVTGSAARREKAILVKKSVYIINFENLRWLWESGFTKFDMIVIDESSKMKSGRKKSKDTNKLSTFGVAAKLCESIPKRVLLTGTMAPNGLHGLWGQIYCVDRGERLGKTRSAFERRWFDKDFMGWKLTPTPTAEAEITNLISDVVISLPESASVSLPEVLTSTIHVTLPPKVMQEYLDLKRTLVSLPLNVSAATRGVLQNKLLQICNGSVYDEDTNIRDVHAEKLLALEDLIEETGGDNLLVLYPYRFDLRQLRERFRHARPLAEGTTIIRDWNAGKVKMLLAHPASCAHGLNLQFGGCRIVWYGLVWDLELYQQANARLCRPGQQSNHCYLHHIIAKNTVEERVLARLNEKSVTQERINAAFIEN